MIVLYYYYGQACAHAGIAFYSGRIPLSNPAANRWPIGDPLPMERIWVTDRRPEIARPPDAGAFSLPWISKNRPVFFSPTVRNALQCVRQFRFVLQLASTLSANRGHKHDYIGRRKLFNYQCFLVVVWYPTIFLLQIRIVYVYRKFMWKKLLALTHDTIENSRKTTGGSGYSGRSLSPRAELISEPHCLVHRRLVLIRQQRWHDGHSTCSSVERDCTFYFIGILYIVYGCFYAIPWCILIHDSYVASVCFDYCVQCPAAC